MNFSLVLSSASNFPKVTNKRELYQNKTRFNLYCRAQVTYVKYEQARKKGPQHPLESLAKNLKLSKLSTYIMF